MRLSSIFKTSGRSFSIPNLPQWKQTRPGWWYASGTKRRGNYNIVKTTSGFGVGFYPPGRQGEDLGEFKSLAEAKEAVLQHHETGTETPEE